MSFTSRSTTVSYPWVQSRTISGVTTVASGIIPSRVISDSKLDVPRVKKPIGWKPPTNYERYGSTLDSLGIPSMYCSGRETNTGHIYIISGADSQNTCSFSWGSHDPETLNKAVLKALEKLKGQNVNYALAFAEARQTSRMIGGTIPRINKAIIAASRGNIRGIARALGITKPPSEKARKYAAKARAEYKKYKQAYIRDVNNHAYPLRDRSAAHNLFLEYQFGWLPLLSDMDGAMHDLYDLHHNEDRSKDTPYAGEPYSYNVKGTSTSISTSKSESNILAFGRVPGKTTRWEKRTHKAKVRLDCYLDNPALAELARTGLLNPLAVVWDKVPWSFVADWFLPIGRYFNALDATTGWKFRGGSYSRKMDVEVKQSYVPRTGAGWNPCFVTGHGRAAGYWLDRKIYVNFPYAEMWHPRNPFKGDAGPTRVAKGIALLQATFGKR